MIYETAISPRALAANLAAYLSDPSTIRARVMDNFGRAPTIEECRNLRNAVVEQRRKEAARHNYRDRIDCRVHDSEVVLGEDGIDRCKQCIEDREAKERAQDAERAREAMEAREQRIAYNNAVRFARTQEQAAMLRRAMVRPRLSGDTFLAVAEAFGVTVDQLLGNRRSRTLCDARTVAIMLLRDAGLSYPRIGSLINRDHSSIINLHKKADITMKRNHHVGRVYGMLRR